MRSQELNSVLQLALGSNYDRGGFAFLTVSMPFDRNHALECYSRAGGNRLDTLRSYCNEVDYRDVFGFARSVDGIQGSLWGIVLGTMGKKNLSVSELEEITRTYVVTNARWVDERGVAALMQWLAWMAWHEGCLEGENPFPDEPDH